MTPLHTRQIVRRIKSARARHESSSIARKLLAGAPRTAVAQKTTWIKRTLLSSSLRLSLPAPVHGCEKVGWLHDLVIARIHTRFLEKGSHAQMMVAINLRHMMMFHSQADRKILFQHTMAGVLRRTLPMRISTQAITARLISRRMECLSYLQTRTGGTSANTSTLPRPTKRASPGLLRSEERRVGKECPV